MRTSRAVLAAALAATLLLAACGGDDDDDTTIEASEADDDTAEGAVSTGTTLALPDTNPDGFVLEAGKSYTATMTTSMGDIVIDLDENAPIAAGQFVMLAHEGFYDGLTFHRVVPNFVIQGGDPNGDGTGGSGSSVVGETPADGYPIGSLAAAKSAADTPGTFDSQFFIVTGEDGTQLPPDYARFGIVSEGLDVALQIEALATGDGPPAQEAVIESVVITEA